MSTAAVGGGVFQGERGAERAHWVAVASVGTGSRRRRGRCVHVRSQRPGEIRMGRPGGSETAPAGLRLAWRCPTAPSECDERRQGLTFTAFMVLGIRRCA